MGCLHARHKGHCFSCLSSHGAQQNSTFHAFFASRQKLLTALFQSECNALRVLKCTHGGDHGQRVSMFPLPVDLVESRWPSLTGAVSESKMPDAEVEPRRHVGRSRALASC